MNIHVEPETMMKLMAIANLTQPKEFSGLGFVRREDQTLVVYDFVLLDIGSSVFTEIPTGKIVDLMQRPDAANMKAWVHQHPMGDGKPGPHNWSGTDEATIKQTPLGGTPELAGWSISMVLTLGGWVGRIDNYKSGKTAHLEVTPSFADVYASVNALRPKSIQAVTQPYAITWRSSGRRFIPARIRAEIMAKVEAVEDATLENLGISREDLIDLVEDNWDVGTSVDMLIGDMTSDDEDNYIYPEEVEDDPDDPIRHYAHVVNEASAPKRGNLHAMTEEDYQRLMTEMDARELPVEVETKRQTFLDSAMETINRIFGGRKL